MDKFRFRVVGIDLDYDLKRYPEGSTIELTLDAAYERRRWLELIGPVEADDDDDLVLQPVPLAPPVPVASEAIVLSAVEALNPADDDNNASDDLPPPGASSELDALGTDTTATSSEQAELVVPPVTESAPGEVVPKAAVKPSASKPASKGASK